MTSITKKIPARIAEIIREKQLFFSGDTVIIAFSGGADSTALLDICCKLPGFKLQLVVAHLNHGLRGAESDADEFFARQTASSYNIRFESRFVDVASLAKTERLSIEDAGRKARIKFFDELSNRFHATAVLLAHHADDQAETVLMRLIRGSGSGGLSGIQYKNSRGYIRPLLSLTKSELEAYLKERSIKWREDASNQDVHYLRNRIRHQILPMLESCNPAIRKRLLESAELLSEEDACMNQFSKEIFGKLCICRDGEVSCQIKLLKRELPALRRRVVRMAFEHVAGDLKHFSRSQSDAIEQLIFSSAPNATVSLPQRLTAIREYQLLHIRKEREVFQENGVIIIDKVGRYKLFGGFSLLIDLVEKVQSDYSKTSPDTAYFDLEQLPFPWTVRTFRPGDKFIPLGMTGSRKVKKLYIDNKVPAEMRLRIPLFFCNDVLIWVGSVRLSSRAVVGKSSLNVVRLLLTKH